MIHVEVKVIAYCDTEQERMVVAAKITARGYEITEFPEKNEVHFMMKQEIEEEDV
jgi:hypothetical protein